MTQQERDYQEELLRAVVAAYYAGVYQQLIVAATGTGKTVAFARLLGIVKHFLPGKALVFAHREELVDQAITTIKEWNPTFKVGKEMASDYADADCDVVVSCVASIGRTGSDRLLRFGNFDVVICDEAHHSVAQTYLNVFETVGVLKPPSLNNPTYGGGEPSRGKLLVGFTATPKRKNRLNEKKQQLLDDDELISLKSVYKKIVFTYPIRKAIKEGWLVPLRGYRFKTTTDISGVKTIAGDFQQDQLADAINTPERNAQVLKAWLENGKGRQTVGFTVDIDHAKALALTFKAAGIKAEAVWGDDPLRAEKLAAHKRKEITVLFNAQVLTEGYDDWRVGCILICAPTRSSTKYTQEVGRGTRLQAGAGNLLLALANGYALEKRDCIVIDMVDNSKKCSLVTLPTLCGLNPEFDLGGGALVEAAEEVEALQEKYPGVDFTALTDLKNVKAYVEAIDIFADPYTEEVKEFSEFTWMVTQDGAYVLPIPERREVKDTQRFDLFLHEKLYITPNDLDEWDLSLVTSKSERHLSSEKTLQEAFTVADDVIRRCRADRVKIMLRDADWHKGPATDGAKKYLRKLTKKKPLLKCICDGWHSTGKVCTVCRRVQGITAGEAATAINRLKVK